MDETDELVARHEAENDCLQKRIAQLEYPCSPHCDGYLREQKLSRDMAAMADELARLQAENARLRKLGDAMAEAIKTLPPDALGVGGRDDGTHWHIRDELLAAWEEGR